MRMLQCPSALAPMPATTPLPPRTSKKKTWLLSYSTWTLPVDRRPSPPLSRTAESLLLQAPPGPIINSCRLCAKNIQAVIFMLVCPHIWPDSVFQCPVSRRPGWQPHVQGAMLWPITYSKHLDPSIGKPEQVQTMFRYALQQHKARAPNQARMHLKPPPRTGKHAHVACKLKPRHCLMDSQVHSCSSLKASHADSTLTVYISDVFLTNRASAPPSAAWLV